MCEIGVNFNNLTFYNEQMRKSMEDKLFFLKQLPAEDNYVFVDFGCADGTMLNILSDMLESNPLKYSYIGYDISDTMINLAKANFHGDANTNSILIIVRKAFVDSFLISIYNTDR